MPLFPSDVLITESLNLIKNDTPFLALHTANPGPTGSGSEVSGGGYARLSVTFGSIAGGQMANTSAVTFSSLPNAAVTHFAIRDAVTGGDLKVYGPITSTVVVSGDQIQFPIGSIVVNLSGS